MARAQTLGGYSNRFLRFRLFPTYAVPATEGFLDELLDVADATFLIDDTHELEAALRGNGLVSWVEFHGRGTPLERIVPCSKEGLLPPQTATVTSSYSPRIRGSKPRCLVEPIQWKNGIGIP